MQHKLISIRTYNSKQELFHAKSLLENNGIKPYTADEHLDIIIGTAISEGYKLQVDETDVEAAEAILSENEKEIELVPNKNYPKAVIYLITAIFASMTIIALLSIKNLLSTELYNINNTERYQSIAFIIFNLIAIASYIGIFYKKKWAWYIFCSSMYISLFELYYSAFVDQNPNIEPITFLIAFSIVGCSGLFFYTKSVREYFKLKKLSNALITTIAAALIGTIVLFAFQPKDTTKTINLRYIQNIDGISYYQNTAFTGTAEYFYPDGVLQTISEYKNGLLNGETLMYTEKGKLQVRTQYVNALKDGKEIKYYDNGKIESDITYKKGRYNGKYSQFYPDGKPTIISTYADSLKHGTYTEYYPNGNKSIETNYSYDQYNGSYKSWDENGKLNRNGQYILNKKNEKWSVWIKGILYQEEEYKNGMRNGLAKYYDNEGVLVEEAFFIDDVKK